MSITIYGRRNQVCMSRGEKQSNTFSVFSSRDGDSGIVMVLGEQLAEPGETCFYPPVIVSDSKKSPTQTMKKLHI